MQICAGRCNLRCTSTYVSELSQTHTQTRIASKRTSGAQVDDGGPWRRTTSSHKLPQQLCSRVRLAVPAATGDVPVLPQLGGPDISSTLVGRVERRVSRYSSSGALSKSASACIRASWRGSASDGCSWVQHGNTQAASCPERRQPPQGSGAGTAPPRPLSLPAAACRASGPQEDEQQRLQELSNRPQSCCARPPLPHPQQASPPCAGELRATRHARVRPAPAGRERGHARSNVKALNAQLQTEPQPRARTVR